jgi:hypothetical protein
MLTLSISIDDLVTPALAELMRLGGDRTDLNEAISLRCSELTRRHLINSSRHETASRLGAAPTYYWQQMGAGVEAAWDARNAFVTFPTGNNADGIPGAEGC